jgi:major type 1 subunit fimbrin (pilin)
LGACTEPRRFINVRKTKESIMKKLHVLALAVSTALCVPLAAQASDGTITFNGVLTASTCIVTTGAAGTFTVTLPTLAASTLATTGATAGATPFTITVDSCTTETSFTPYFETGATTDLVTGNLKTTQGVGKAANVELQLLNGDATVINVAAGPGVQGVLGFSRSTATGGVGNYIVRYKSTGAATAGAVTSSVTYSMVYL